MNIVMEKSHKIIGLTSAAIVACSTITHSTIDNISIFRGDFEQTLTTINKSEIFQPQDFVQVSSEGVIKTVNGDYKYSMPKFNYNTIRNLRSATTPKDFCENSGNPIFKYQSEINQVDQKLICKTSGFDTIENIQKDVVGRDLLELFAFLLNSGLAGYYTAINANILIKQRLGEYKPGTEGKDQVNFDRLVKARNLENNKYSDHSNELMEKVLLLKSRRLSKEHDALMIEFIKQTVDQIVEFYKFKYDIELGKIDMTTGTLLYYETSPTAAGSTMITGKTSNNIYKFCKEDIVNLNTNKTKSNMDFLQFKSTVVHELHHKLFNLDNRFDLKTGYNISNELIPNSKREGFIEYLTMRFMEHQYGYWHGGEGQNMVKLVDEFKTTKYKNYRGDVDNYLSQLGLQISKDNSKWSYEHARLIIDVIFANFFLGADPFILDYAESKGIKNILQD
jgi:hypothetical protein